MNVFEHLEQRPNLVPGRYYTKELTPDGKSVAEVNIYNDPEEKGKKIAKLSFIRSTNTHKFKDLMKAFLCQAKKKGYTKVKLEDDALFTKEVDGEDCTYRALFYRLFEGKNSLYIDQGFRPIVDISREKAILLKATLKTIKEFATLLPEELQAKIKDVPDEKLFRTWVLEQDCMIMREFINKIEAVAAKLKAETNITNDAREFLKSWRAYYQAHQHLERIPECTKSGGGLRSRTYSSSRGKYKRGNTRKNRRNRKISAKTRNSRK